MYLDVILNFQLHILFQVVFHRPCNVLSNALYRFIKKKKKCLVQDFLFFYQMPCIGIFLFLVICLHQQGMKPNFHYKENQACHQVEKLLYKNYYQDFTENRRSQTSIIKRIRHATEFRNSCIKIIIKILQRIGEVSVYRVNFKNK